MDEVFDVETYLNNLPADSIKINLDGKGITALPSFSRFTNLRKLYIERNRFTHLSGLPEGLTVLFCDKNGQLETIESLPSTLVWLNCYDCALTSLPPLPEGLKVLHCESNKLRELPPLPSTLGVLYADENDIQELPPLPDTLTNIEVSQNKHLANLPPLPPGLVSLKCLDTSIKTFPNIPTTLQTLFWNVTNPPPDGNFNEMPYEQLRESMENSYNSLREKYPMKYAVN